MINTLKSFYIECGYKKIYCVNLKFPENFKNFNSSIASSTSECFVSEVATIATQIKHAVVGRSSQTEKLTKKI